MLAATTSFSKTSFFDVRNTPSEVGLLSETFRKRDGVIRSCVPMVSFIAWGSDVLDFTRSYDAYLDPESPFLKLLELDGKIILFGVDYDRCTLCHLSEERLEVD